MMSIIKTIVIIPIQNDQCYSLEDNIIKGPEKPIDLISFNIGEVLLDAFNKNPNHISQVLI